MYYCSVLVCLRQTDREREVLQSTEKTRLFVFVCVSTKASQSVLIKCIIMCVCAQINSISVSAYT